MDLTLTDTQSYLQEAVARTVARDASTRQIRQWMTEEDLGPAHRMAARQGWTGIGLPEDAGGQGGGVQDLALVAEELGRGAVPWDQMLATCVVGPALAASGPRGVELAGAGAEGESTSALCIDARTPSLEGACLDVIDDRVDGAVRFILGGASADTLVVARRTADADSVELLEVARGGEGVSVSRRRLVDGTRDLSDVTFTRAPCRVVGVVPTTVIQNALLRGTVLVGADLLGSAARMLEMTTEYVKDRRQFGVAVGSFQAVKHSAAQMLVDVEGMRSAVQFAAWAVETEAEDVQLQASVAGAYCSKAALDVADRALFLHGAIGYTWEHDLHLLFKRAKSGAALFGSADWHHEEICRALESWRLITAR